MSKQERSGDWYIARLPEPRRIAVVRADRAGMVELAAPPLKDWIGRPVDELARYVTEAGGTIQPMEYIG